MGEEKNRQGVAQGTGGMLQVKDGRGIQTMRHGENRLQGENNSRNSIGRYI